MIKKEITVHHSVEVIVEVTGDSSSVVGVVCSASGGSMGGDEFLGVQFNESMGSIIEDKIGATILLLGEFKCRGPHWLMPLEISAQQLKDFNSPGHVSAPVPFDHVWH
ncbi:hypothetical protein RHMOL_Rhmol05G0324800 [Rhododendron molle]|uniref:Uncharacterized protein n=1 Tax=Rhododendron molle TaxID=49168 RepID=A0ACC0NV76_RHOML|nr:hypothetical protein RHMOL_Rhmol05G0324800 [Rhododendron molle]